MTKNMRIRSAVGFGIFLISLRIIMPAVFTGLEHTLVLFFGASSGALEHSSAAIENGFQGALWNIPEVPTPPGAE